jgi:hypothetical protein
MSKYVPYFVMIFILRSLDCVEDNDEEEQDEVNKVVTLPVTTILHVGPLRKKTDCLKNQSVPSLADSSDNSHLSSSVSLPICPIHGTSRDLIVPVAKSEPRIVISPRVDSNKELAVIISILTYMQLHVLKNLLLYAHAHGRACIFILLSANDKKYIILN